MGPFALKTLLMSPTASVSWEWGQRQKERPGSHSHFPREGRKAALERRCPRGLSNWKVGTVDAAPG